MTLPPEGDGPTSTTAGGPGERRGTLPTNQPARTLAVLTVYALAMIVVIGVLSARLDGLLVPLLAGGFATLGLVLVAALAPRRQDRVPRPGAQVPVLRRPSPGDAADESGATNL